VAGVVAGVNAIGFVDDQCFRPRWGGFDVADTREARNLNVNHDEQRSKTEDENDDEDEDEDDLGRKEASRKKHTVKNRPFD
jgi:hypothetical protein